MNVYYLRYQSLDIKDLLRIIEGYQDLLLPAKRALLKHIETMEDRSEISDEIIEEIKASIELDNMEVRDLKFFDRLGVGFNDEGHQLVIKKNKFGRNRDRLATIVGIIMTIFTLPALGSALNLLKDFSLPGLLGTVILAVIGVTGINLLVKTFDRRLAVKRFSITKNNSGITILNNPMTRIKEQSFNSGAELDIVDGQEDYTILVLRTSDSELINILKFKKLEPLLYDSLKYATQKFNNWQ